MPGYNHYLDCDRGWCVKRSGVWTRRRPDLRTAPVFRTYWVSYESYTVPNARCPVCGDAVFFYQSPHGGRVYFDELGPPWPKHPCTDNPRPRAAAAPRDDVPIPRNERRAAGDPTWLKEGWMPLRLVRMLPQKRGRSGQEPSEWWKIEAFDVATDSRVGLVLDEWVDLDGVSIALISEWDATMRARLAVLIDDGQGVRGEVYTVMHSRAAPPLRTPREMI